MVSTNHDVSFLDRQPGYDMACSARISRLMYALNNNFS